MNIWLARPTAAAYLDTRARLHRYLPAEPNQPGNPVLSVYQTDVIYYGRDIRSYLALELPGLKNDVAAGRQLPHVPFWSELIDANNARAG